MSELRRRVGGALAESFVLFSPTRQCFKKKSEWYLDVGDVTGSHPPSPRGDVKWTCGRELVLHAGIDISGPKQVVLDLHSAVTRPLPVNGH